MRLVLLLGALAACAPPPPVPPAEVPAVTASRDATIGDLAAGLAAKSVPLLIDVRTPEEYRGGHVPGAMSLPLDQLTARAAELTPHRSSEVWIICLSGRRSAAAAQTLSGLGFRTVNVLGGTAAWIGAGNPTE